MTQVQFLEAEIAKGQERSVVGRQIAATGKQHLVEFPLEPESLVDLLRYLESMATAVRRSAMSLAEAVDRLDPTP